jgi:hypothetical protein
MQINLFYHLVMKSAIDRPNRDDDFCFTGKRYPHEPFLTPSKACCCTLWIVRIDPQMASRSYAGKGTGTGKMTMDGI